MNKKIFLFIAIGILLVISTFFLIRTNLEGNIIEQTIQGEIAKLPEMTPTKIEYKNYDMNIEFKKGDKKIGEAKLESHRNIDEVRKVGVGEEVLMWYEFSDFWDIEKNALNGVEFIDMRETIAFEDKEKDVSTEIENSNYLKPIEKEYSLVYLNERGEWIEYNSRDIPQGNITIGVKADISWGEYLDVVWNIMDNEIDKHALVLGDNSGFVALAPSVDPAGSGITLDGLVLVTGDTSPANADGITRIGWWADQVDTSASYEIGLYADSGGVPGNLLYSDSGSVSTSNEGSWDYVNVDWEISPSTKYWIAVQMDAVSGSDRTNYKSNSGQGYDSISGVTTLPNPFNGGSLSDSNGMISIYAVYSESIPPSCAISLGANKWFVPSGCTCYCDGSTINLADCSCTSS